VNAREAIAMLALAAALLGCAAAEPAGQPAAQARCEQPPDGGPCKAAIERFYFDRARGICRAFDWGGCAGSMPFETIEPCRQTCEAAPRAGVERAPLAEPPRAARARGRSAPSEASAAAMLPCAAMAELSRYTVGAGPKLTVLLHGFLGMGKNLRTLASRWAERDAERRFIVPDLYGHGESPPLPPGATSDSLAAAVLHTAGHEAAGASFSIVGHSLGARVALAAVRRDPERVEQVVMLDMTPGPLRGASSETRGVLDALLRAPEETDDRRSVRSALVADGLPPALADWLLMNLSQQGGRYRWRIDRRALADLHERFVTEDLWPIAEARQVPIRCIHGERSPYVTDADAARLRAAGGDVVTLAGAGHYVHVDALDALLDALTAADRSV
jgi:esterase